MGILKRIPQNYMKKIGETTMKKIIKLLSAILIIYITAAALPKLMPAATLETNSDSDVMFQTWEEFLESGVKDRIRRSYCHYR